MQTSIYFFTEKTIISYKKMEMFQVYMQEWLYLNRR
jgi:hypothetical protein